MVGWVLFDHAVNTAAFGVLNPHGVVQYCTPKFERLLGSPGSVAGTRIGDWLHPKDGEAAAWFVARRRSEGHLVRADTSEELCYRLDPMPGSADGGAVLFLTHGTADLDLLHARAFQLNPGLSAISVLDTGEHLDVNDAWLRNMEYRREEVIGRTAGELQIWENGDTTRAEIVQKLREGGKVANFEARMRTRTGKLRNIVVSAERVEHAGQTLAFFASHDITAVKQAQEKLALMNRQLEQRIRERTAEIEQKNKDLAAAVERAEAANEAKSHFLSVMSHEIRTPLNAVINTAELLAESASRGPGTHHLAGIVSSARALAALVDDVLDLSRIEAGHLELSPVETDIGDAMDETVQIVAPLAHRKGLDIVLTFGPGLPARGEFDPVRLRQILLNLIGNAVKYTQSGWIEIRGDVVEEAGERSLVVEVLDTGIGIKPEDQERIFERFSRIGAYENQVQGVGLGLNISAGLVQAMGGTIDVKSSVGRGSSFRVALPIGPSTGAGGYEWPAPGSVALLGPPTKTREAFEAALSAKGAGVSVVETADPDIAIPQHRMDAALIAVPLGTDPTVFLSEWRETAKALADEIVLFVPAGSVLPDPAQGEESGLHVETYPLSPTRLLAALQRRHGTEGEPLPKPPSGPSLAGIRILVADDVEENRVVARGVLAASGAEVVTVDSGEAAIACIAERPFDIILLDLRMPDLNGYEAAARIRASGGKAASVPIVAVSASIAPDAPRMEAAGIDGFLAKPFTPEQLRSKVRAHVKDTGTIPANSEPEAGENMPPVLDETILSTLVSYAGLEAVTGAVNSFIGTLEERVAAIQSADNETSADAAHTLAGAAGALGLLELAAHCHRLLGDGREARRAEEPSSIVRVAQRAVQSLKMALAELKSLSR